MGWFMKLWVPMAFQPPLELSERGGSRAASCSSRASKAEVEFVYETTDGRIIPIEVKSGKNTGAKSVRSFSQKYEVPYVIKASAKNFGHENGIRSLPLYAVFALSEDA